MSRKTRKLIWAAPLVAAFAVIGALALFMTLTPNDASAQANVEIPPGQPVGLTAVAYVDGTEQEEIQLDWTEPTDGGSARTYRIDFSDNGGYTWVALESDVRGTSYTHDGLMAAETYHYRVFALNQHGISGVSDIVSGTTAKSWVPKRPDDLRAVVGGSGPIADTDSDLEITLTWDAPVDPDGAPVKSYEVQYSVDGDVWDPVPEVKKPGQKHTMLTEDLDTLEAGVGYQYRVRAKNSVGNSKWSSTAKAATLPGAIPGKPATTDFTPGVAPVELNTWLFWEPPTDPKGDAVTGYEVVGRPIRVMGPRLFGGPPATLANLKAVTDGPSTDSPDPDDKRGFITVEGFHSARDINFGAATDFATVATTMQASVQSIGGVITGATVWDEAAAIAHPSVVSRSEGTPAATVYYASKQSRDARTTGVDGYVAHTAPPSAYWTKVGTAPALDWTGATVTYTGLRFVLYIPRATTATAMAGALKTPGGSVASLLGWTGGSGFRSDPEFKCCPVPSVAAVTADTSVTPPVIGVDAANAMPGWKVVKTDLDRPNATDINQFLVTTNDISNTGYSAQWKANIDWQFRVRALNRRAPANATQDDVAIADDSSMLEASWSDVINARPGSDSALQRPEDLTIKRSPTDHDGRTGLILTWDKATTVPDSDGNSVNAAAYRVEYSDTGLEQDGYDWKVLKDIEVPGDASENQQMFTDKAGKELSASDTLHAGQTRHYRVFALGNLGTGNVIAKPTLTTTDATSPQTGVDLIVVTAVGTQMSWPSPQKFGGTADPLKPEPPQRLRVTERGHTHIDLAWTAPDAAPNDDDDGSEEGSSVITEYILEISDDGGNTWTRRIDYDDKTGDAMKITGTSYTDSDLMPGQTRDYRVRAVNSSHMSIWSNTAAGTTQEAVLPNEPGGLTAESASPTSIKLCWNTQAEQPEDAPVTEYVIEYSANGKTGWKELAKVTDYTHDTMKVMRKGEEVEIETNKQTYTIYTDMTLTPGQTRHYRVFARNLRGLSDQSDVAMAMTPDADAPAAPMGVTADATSQTMVTVRWDASADPPGAPVTGYKVMWKMASVADYADADMAEVMADARMYQVTGLTAGTEYDFAVMAKNAKGYSAMSTEVSETTQAEDTTLTEPTNVMAVSIPIGHADNTTGTNDVRVTWTDGANADQHAVILFDADWQTGNRIQGAQTDGNTMFLNVPAGSYTAVVVAMDAAFTDMKIGFDPVTVP